MQRRQAMSAAVLILAGAVLAYIGFSGFYTVREFEQAVVLRFGRQVATVGPGLHFMVPLIDRRVVVDCSEQALRLPWTQSEFGDRESRATRDESLILTGDLYAAVVEWNVVWRVVEPADYLFSVASQSVSSTIEGVARSTMHRIVGDYSADEVLTDKRSEIGLAALQEMKAVLDRLGMGVEVVDLQLQRVTPPDRVKPAFDDVNASIQQRDKLVNEARRERNSILPLAQAERDKLIREAEGYAARRRAEAEGEIDALLAKYKSYQLAPEVTRQRLYLESMEKVLLQSGPKLILDQDFKGLMPLLPIQN
jgi:membrane protease subunit HflK